MKPHRASPGSVLVSRLAELGRRQALGRGEVVFHQGDSALELYCLLEGRLRLERHLVDGHVVTVGVARGPDLVADAALFSSHFRCSATTETSCCVSRVAKADVLDRLERDPSLALDLIRSLTDDVRELRGRLELRNVRPASERLMEYLRLQQENGKPKGDRPLSAVASELGLTPEAIYRVVRRLENEGRLRRRGRRLEPLP